MNAAERDPEGVFSSVPPYQPHERQGWAELEWIAMTDRRDSVRLYARLGLHPIAIHGLEADGSCTCHRSECGAAGKHPALRAWQQAPLDVDELDRMLVTNRRLNIGLRMGRQPGGMHLIAIDVDGPRSLLGPLEAEHGALPPTLTARTGSGGLHMVFRVPPERAPGNRVHLAPSVDVRAEGGQIVAAPSRHRTGNTYSWVNCIEPAELYR